MGAAILFFLNFGVGQGIADNLFVFDIRKKTMGMGVFYNLYLMGYKERFTELS